MANEPKEDVYKEKIEEGSAVEREVEEPVVPEQREPQEAREADVERVRRVREEIEKKAEEYEIQPELQEEFTKHAQAQKSGALNEDARVKHLLDLARTKGMLYAVKIAKQTNAYALDRLHDVLEENGLYKQYIE